MKIFELDGKRFDAALELLSDGKFILYESIGIKITDSNIVDISIPSSCLYIINITKNNVIKDLEYGKNKFNVMLDHSAKFSNLLLNKEVIFSVFFDMGKSGIGICEERNNQINWLIEDIS